MNTNASIDTAVQITETDATLPRRTHRFETPFFLSGTTYEAILCKESTDLKLPGSLSEEEARQMRTVVETLREAIVPVDQMAGRLRDSADGIVQRGCNLIIE